MTEKEKLQLAKKYIDYLARGFNPLDESPISNDDVVRNVRISKCLLYVSEVLEEVIDKGINDSKPYFKKEKKPTKEEFSISYEDRERFVFSARPLTVSEIAKGISEIIDADNIKPLKATVINEWLLQNGFLYEEVRNGKSHKLVTEEGKSIGINEVEMISQSGIPYKRLTHSIESQQFIIDNLDSIIEYNSIRKTVKRVEKAEREYLNNKSKYTGNILDEVIRDLYAAGATIDDIVSVTDQSYIYIQERMKFLKLI